jgi:hypothetical protein
LAALAPGSALSSYRVKPTAATEAEEGKEPSDSGERNEEAEDKCELIGGFARISRTRV